MNQKIWALLLAVVATCVPAWGTAYFSRATGNWSATSTWSTAACGGAAAAAFPGSGDTAEICNTNTVTISGNTTVGAQGATGTFAIKVNQGGTLVTNAGTVLTARGDIQFQLGGNPQINGSLSFDTPAATVYKIVRIAGGAGTSTVTLGPASGPRETFQTITTLSTATDFRVDGQTVGGFNLVVQNAIINQCGGGVNHCIDVAVGTTQPTCTFTNVLVENSGQFGCDGSGSGATIQTASHVDVRSTTSTSGFDLRMDNTTALTTGQRSFDNITCYNSSGTNGQKIGARALSFTWGNATNATKGGLAAGTNGGALFNCGWAIGSNGYIGNVTFMATGNGWENGPQVLANVTIDGNLFYTHYSNPHFLAESTSAALTANSYQNNACDADNFYSSDGGDFVIGGPGASTITKNLLINACGTIVTGLNASAAMTITNNTTYHSWSANFGETAGGAGQLVSMKNNLLTWPCIPYAAGTDCDTVNGSVGGWKTSGLSSDTALVRMTGGPLPVDYNFFFGMIGSGDANAAACVKASFPCPLTNATLGVSSYVSFPDKQITIGTAGASSNATTLNATGAGTGVQGGDYVLCTGGTGCANGDYALVASATANQVLMASPGIANFQSGSTFITRPSYSATTTDIYGTTAGFGTHDQHQNPNFRDATRTTAKWDTSLGGAGTITSTARNLVTLNGYDYAGAATTAAAGYNTAAALAYLRYGFTPTNQALKGAGFDGSDIGALPVASTSTRRASVTWR